MGADDKQSRTLAEDTPLAHAWSRDSKAVLAMRSSDELRLQLVSLDVATGRETLLAKDIGPFPPSNVPVEGLSLAPDGRSLLTAIVRLRGDVWLLSGFEARTPGVFERLLPGLTRPGSP